MWVLLAIGVAAGMVLGLPQLARHVPWSTELWLARVVGGAPPGVPCGEHEASASKAALDKLVRRIYPLAGDETAVPIRVEAVRNDSVNAVATLGGRVYVFEGLIKQAESPEELAGVLAHEIEHVLNRHIIQGVAVDLLTFEALRIVLPSGDPSGTRMAHLVLTMQFGRKQEAEADEKGLERLRAAQVDAGGFEQFFARAQRMPSPPPFLSNHPSNESRQALAASFRGYETRPVLDAGEWQSVKAICRS
jgi:predicted Zn-dependent protease